MTKHVIKPFITSRIPCDSSIFTYLNNMGQVVMTPVIAWFIEGPDEKILVDTGISAEVCNPYWPGAEDATPLEKALKSVQLAPEDIDIIIREMLVLHLVNRHQRLGIEQQLRCFANFTDALLLREHGTLDIAAPPPDGDIVMIGIGERR